MLNPPIYQVGRFLPLECTQILVGSRLTRPSPTQVVRLGVVALGVVVGFPLFSSLALTEQTASHGAVVVATLPAATAVFAVLRGGERPSSRFWLAASASFVAVLGFVAVSGGLSGGFHLTDLWLLVADRGIGGASSSAWLGFAYVTTVSMFLGFFPWYAGLARGGVARIAQVQSLRPVLTLGWSALLLDEHVSALTALVALIVLTCVLLTQRTR